VNVETDLSTIDIPAESFEEEPNEIDETTLTELPLNEELAITVSKSLEEPVIEDTKEEPESKTMYKDMNMTQLKALVIEQGLVSNANRMKKAELIEVLENSEKTT
jgi:hypothetical protein